MRFGVRVLGVYVVAAVDGDPPPRAHGQHGDSDVGGVDEVHLGG